MNGWKTFPPQSQYESNLIHTFGDPIYGHELRCGCYCRGNNSTSLEVATSVHLYGATVTGQSAPPALCLFFSSSPPAICCFSNAMLIIHPAHCCAIIPCPSTTKALRYQCRNLNIKTKIICWGDHWPITMHHAFSLPSPPYKEVYKSYYVYSSALKLYSSIFVAEEKPWCLCQLPSSCCWEILVLISVLVSLMV